MRTLLVAVVFAFILAVRASHVSGAPAVPNAIEPTPPPVTPGPIERPARWSRDVHASIGLIGGLPGEETSVEAYSIGYSGEVEPFHVDAAKVHVDRAGLDGRIERRDVGRVGRIVYWSSDYTTRAQQALIVPRALLRLGMQRLVLRLDPGAVTRDGETQTLSADDEPRSRRFVRVYVPQPDAEPAALADLVGTEVAPRTTLTLRCPLPANFVAWFETKPNARFRIAQVTREIGHAAVLRPDSDAGRMGNSTVYKAIDPIQITVDQSQRPPLGAPFVTSRRFPAPAPPPRRATGIDYDRCAPLEFYAADRADLARTVALP
jgi:hypothetical protein